jgi:hypothetical protein
MDFSRAGLDSFKKYAVIVLWVALSGALTSLIEYVGGLEFEAPAYVAILAIVNYILKAALTWVTTKK